MNLPVTLEQISFVSWLRFGAGLVLFLGPGSLILSFSPFRKDLDGTAKFLVAFGYSAGVWAVFLSITNLLSIKLSSLISIGIFAFCWAVALWKSRFWEWSIRSFRISKAAISQIILLGFLLVVVIIRLWVVRQELAGLGSDSYHHTLFTQLIMDQGAIPQDYGPGYPIVTFTYHYGFHATAAFLGWVSGIPTRLLLLVLGYVIIAICSLAVGFSAEKMVGTKIAGMTAAILTAAFFVFPTHMLLWGRYTQSTGLTLMAIFLGLFWLWIKGGFSKSGIVELGILAAGIGLTHYRIVALTALGALVIAFVTMLGKEHQIQWKILIFRGVSLFFIALVCAAPWLYQLWRASQTGYPIITAPATDFYFSIERLGLEALNFPLNKASLILIGASLLFGWLSKNKVVIALTLWSLIALVPSQNVLLLDTISVVISLFVPFGIITAWGINALIEKIHASGSPRVIKAVSAPLVLSALVIGSLYTIITYPTPLYSFLKESDLRAFEFIDEQLPTDAKFMVNMYRFPFSDTLMIGIDGGYWIPLLAKRQSVMPPMTFTAEYVSDPTFADRLRTMEGLNSQLTSNQGLEILDNENITHVYIGERGGPINPAELLNSPKFRLVYEDGNVHIFEYNW